MPEQFKDIAQQIENQKKVDIPILSEDQLAELDMMLTTFMSRPSSCTIRLYEDGYINTYECIIEGVDHLQHSVTVYDCDTQMRMTFQLDCIVGIND